MSETTAIVLVVVTLAVVGGGVAAAVVITAIRGYVTVRLNGARPTQPVRTHQSPVDTSTLGSHPMFDR